MPNRADQMTYCFELGHGCYRPEAAARMFAKGRYATLYRDARAGENYEIARFFDDLG